MAKKVDGRSKSVQETQNPSSRTEQPPLSGASLVEYRLGLIQQRDQLAGQIRQIQATGNELVGQLNQVAGAITAVDKIMGESGKGAQ